VQNEQIQHASLLCVRCLISLFTVAVGASGHRRGGKSNSCTIHYISLRACLTPVISFLIKRNEGKRSGESSPLVPRGHEFEPVLHCTLQG
jgi:hypothetical protein